MTPDANPNAQSEFYRVETTASDGQLDFRQQLEELFVGSPLPKEDLLFNLGMYTRASLLVKFLVMSDLYERILGIPGVLMEFGVWWGQNLVLLENLRAIHEPFNKQRSIIGFDTFAGYTPPSPMDKQDAAWGEGAYATPIGHRDYLAHLLEVHEGNNILGHVRNLHHLVEGDVEQTVPKYFEDHPETIVALAYFDLGLYAPTKAALMAIKPHLVPKSVILMDELSWGESPGEAIAFKEVFGGTPYDIEKCRLYPSKTIITLR